MRSNNLLYGSEKNLNSIAQLSANSALAIPLAGDARLMPLSSNFADSSNKESTAIVNAIIVQLNHPLSTARVAPQTAGRYFEEITRDFLQPAFGLLQHVRPGKWQFHAEAVDGPNQRRRTLIRKSIAEFEQFVTAKATPHISWQSLSNRCLHAAPLSPWAQVIWTASTTLRCRNSGSQ